MTGAPRELKDIFLEALERPERERESFVREACDGDERLEAEALELLAASVRAGSFLEGGEAGAERYVGQVVDGYRLVEVIGEGGFGTVFAAMQEHPIVRRVALKIVKPGMDSDQVVARFETERQALALMDHPGVARVLDAGTTPAGRPYFVMEFVDGVPVTTYCEEHALDLAARLRLFEQTLRAVQHAHQKGVLHRDLKPTNLLVTEVDGVPVPKVIDFGIAKAIGGVLPSVTRTGSAGFVGTPEYAAPEQFEQNGDVDTRADVFSLGVLLYRLLCGRSPYERGDSLPAGLGEWVRAIHEHRPVPPSARASDVPSDLDWIVARAMEPERSRRYPTIDAFAADVLRFLEGRPVDAGPPGHLYRARKFVGRHRFVFSGLTIVVVGSLIATAVALSIAREASRQAYVANIFAASAALRDHNTTEARLRLDRASPRLRGWEWRYLDRRVDRSEWSFGGDDDPVFEFDVTPSRASVVVARESGRLERVEASTGAVTDSANWPGTPCGLLAWDDAVVATMEDGSIVEWRPGDSPERVDGHGDAAGQVVATGPTTYLTVGEDGVLRSREFGVERERSTVELGAASRKLWVSPDRELVAVETYDQRLTMVDVTDGAILARARVCRASTAESAPWRWAPGRVSDVAFTLDGERVVVSTRDGGVSVRDARTLAPIWIDDDPRPLVRTVAVSADGRHFAFGCDDHSIHVVAASDFERVARLVGHDHAVRDVEFTDGGDVLLSAGWDGGIGVWKVPTGESVASLLGHGHGIIRLDVDDGSSAFCSRGNDGTVRLWAFDEVRSEVLRGFGTHVRAIAFTDAGELVVTTIGDEYAKTATASLWDVGTGRRLAERAGLPGLAESVRVLTEDGRIAVGSSQGVLTTFRWSDPERDRFLPMTEARVDAIAYAAEHERLVTCGADGLLRAFGAAFEVTGEAWLGTRLRDVVFAGSTVAVSGDDGRVRVLSVDDLSHEFEVAVSSAPASCLALHPNGNVLAVGCDDRSIALVDLDRRAVRARLEGHGQEVTGLAWFPDGSRLVSCSRDRTVRLWDVDEEENVMTLHGHTREVMSVAVSPDGRTIATGAEDETVRLWRAR